MKEIQHKPRANSYDSDTQPISQSKLILICFFIFLEQENENEKDHMSQNKKSILKKKAGGSDMQTKYLKKKGREDFAIKSLHNVVDAKKYAKKSKNIGRTGIIDIHDEKSRGQIIQGNRFSDIIQKRILVKTEDQNGIFDWSKKLLYKEIGKIKQTISSEQKQLDHLRKYSKQALRDKKTTKKNDFDRNLVKSMNNELAMSLAGTTGGGIDILDVMKKARKVYLDEQRKTTTNMSLKQMSDDKNAGSGQNLNTSVDDVVKAEPPKRQEMIVVLNGGRRSSIAGARFNFTGS